jgi:hypothetical protein
MSRVRPHDVRKDDSPNSKAEWFCYIKKAENTKKWNEMGNKQLGRDASHTVSKHNSGPSSPCALLHFQQDGKPTQIIHQPDAKNFQFIILTFIYSSTCFDTKVKPGAATAAIEHLMMGGKTRETCSAVNIRQDNKLEICCIWLVKYLNCMMMHGSTNTKKMVNQF